MKVKCPKCGAIASGASIGRKAYCKVCGWNVDVASATLRTESKTLWVVGAFGCGLAAVAWIRGPYGFQGSVMIGAAFVLFPVCVALLDLVRLKKLRDIRVRADEFVPQVATGDSATSLLDENDPRIALPRSVRLSLRGWLYSFAVVGIAVLLLSVLNRMSTDIATSFRQQPGMIGFTLLMLGAYLWLCGRFFFRRWKEWQLFNSGKFARGIVLQQQTESRSFPWIVYGFRDAVGRPSQSRVKDFTLKLYEQMPVSVFYDEDDPSQSAALESSLFRMR
jgi:hypothetical protein